MPLPAGSRACACAPLPLRDDRHTAVRAYSRFESNSRKKTIASESAAAIRRSSAFTLFAARLAYRIRSPHSESGLEGDQVRLQRATTSAAAWLRNFHSRPALPCRQTDRDLRRTIMGFGRGLLLWLLGIPLPIIILLAIFWHH
jgi:hypothetical protein